MQYELNKEVKLLVINHSEEKVKVVYNANEAAFEMPKIGPRPPYFFNPRYEPFYPVI